MVKVCRSLKIASKANGYLLGNQKGSLTVAYVPKGQFMNSSSATTCILMVLLVKHSFTFPPSLLNGHLQHGFKRPLGDS